MFQDVPLYLEVLITNETVPSDYLCEKEIFDNALSIVWKIYPKF